MSSTGGAPLHTAAEKNASRATFVALLSARPAGCGASTETLMNGDTTALYLAAQVFFYLFTLFRWTVMHSPPPPLSKEGGYLPKISIVGLSF